MDKINSEGLNLLKLNIDKLKQIFPECISDGKINYERLKELLGCEIDDSVEKYSFNWVGKNNSIKNSLIPSKSTLLPLKEKSLNWDVTNNIYIEGDNLEVLKTLEKTYYKKIKMIYIDPPYNTGNDFVYKDDFSDSIKNYMEMTNQECKSNPETSGRYHTDWLNMIYPRLLVASNLLSEDGVIFISIDYNESANLRKICDEIFGETNYVQEIIWHKKFSPQNDAHYFSINHETIFCYAKNKLMFNRNLLPATDEMIKRYKNLDNDPRGPWTSGDCTIGRNTENDYYPIITPSGREVYPSNGNVWRYSKETFKKLIDDNRIWFGENGDNMPRVKRFLSETNNGIVPISIWSFEEVGHTQSASQELKKLFDNQAVFDYPKPVKLIKKMLLIATDKDSIVLDFFSGSSTTAHAVMQLNREDNGNRKFIMVQLPELLDSKSDSFKLGYKNICDIGEERIRRASKMIRDEFNDYNSKLSEKKCNLDLGFKVFKLESSNIKAWDSSLKLDETSLLDQLETIKEDRTDLDVAYEIMLKYGVFNMPLEEVKINNKTMFNVGNGFLIIDLNNDTILEDVEAIGKEKPHCVVFKESGFKDDNAKLNAVKTLETFSVQDIKCL